MSKASQLVGIVAENSRSLEPLVKALVELDYLVEGKGQVREGFAERVTYLLRHDRENTWLKISARVMEGDNSSVEFEVLPGPCELVLIASEISPATGLE